MIETGVTGEAGVNDETDVNGVLGEIGIIGEIGVNNGVLDIVLNNLSLTCVDVATICIWRSLLSTDDERFPLMLDVSCHNAIKIYFKNKKIDVSCPFVAFTERAAPLATLSSTYKNRFTCLYHQPCKGNCLLVPLLLVWLAANKDWQASNWANLLTSARWD